MRRRRAWSAAQLAVMVVVLTGGVAGCSAGRGPVTQPTAPQTARTAATPDVTRGDEHTRRPGPAPGGSATSRAFDARVAPPEPVEIDGPPSEDSAVAVARYVMTLFPYVFASADTAPWDALAGPSCAYCANVSEMAADLAEKGERRQGGEIAVTWAQGFDHRPVASQYAVSLEFTEQPSRVLDAHGEVTDASPDVITAKAQVLLTWDGGAWVVDGVDITVVDRS